jgi:hypothetical protein
VDAFLSGRFGKSGYYKKPSISKNFDVAFMRKTGSASVGFFYPLGLFLKNLFGCRSPALGKGCSLKSSNNF